MAGPVSCLVDGDLPYARLEAGEARDQVRTGSRGCVCCANFAQAQDARPTTSRSVAGGRTMGVEVLPAITDAGRSSAVVRADQGVIHGNVPMGHRQWRQRSGRVSASGCCRRTDRGVREGRTRPWRGNGCGWKWRNGARGSLALVGSTSSPLPAWRDLCLCERPQKRGRVRIWWSALLEWTPCGTNHLLEQGVLTSIEARDVRKTRIKVRNAKRR